MLLHLPDRLVNKKVITVTQASLKLNNKSNIIEGHFIDIHTNESAVNITDLIVYWI